MADVTISESLLTTSSTVFEIMSEGLMGDMTKRIRGVVERRDGNLRIVSWKVE